MITKLEDVKTLKPGEPYQVFLEDDDGAPDTYLKLEKEYERVFEACEKVNQPASRKTATEPKPTSRTPGLHEMTVSQLRKHFKGKQAVEHAASLGLNLSKQTEIFASRAIYEYYRTKS